MNWNNRDTVWIYTLAVATLALIGVLYAGYLMPEWKDHQAGFRELVEKRFGPARASQVTGGLQQIWVRELGRTDRCVTCHMGVEWKGLESAPHPFRSHPKGILEKHPLPKYGCTICHGGQGYAAAKEAAHGVDIEHWEYPLLGGQMAKTYVISERKALLESNCNICHRYDRETKGADYINNAKQIVRDKGCRACHIINGRGGVVGPNLSFVGDLAPEQYDYSRLGGKHSVFAWHMAHFKNPKSMAAETVMPNFSFGSKDAQSLTMLAMSWKQAKLPVEYIPGVETADLPTREEKEKEERMMTGEGAFFVKKNCFICHDVSTLGIESAAKIGPDLALAVTDVQSRFGRTLEDFLKNPTGTMSMVLATQIPLTDVEKAEAVEKLRLAYQKKVEQDAKGAQRK